MSFLNLKLKINAFRLAHKARKVRKAIQSTPDIDAVIDRMLANNNK